MGRTERVDDKNGIIFLVMFSPAITVLKMSQMVHFLYLLMTAKNQSQFRQNLNASERSHLALRKCYVLLGSELPLARCEPLKIQNLGNLC